MSRSRAILNKIAEGVLKGSKRSNRRINGPANAKMRHRLSRGSNMNKVVKQDKFTVRDEREQLREIFIKRAGEPPIPDNLFGPDPVWDAYVQEMRDLERQLREAGEQL